MGPVDVSRLLDDGPWTGYQRWLVMLAALTIIFDGIDNQLLGIAIPSLLVEWGVARSAFSPVVSLGFVGMMIGGATAGLAGDRFGRRSALLGSVTLFGAATLAVVAVEGIASLAALRLVAGIGLGGAIPNAATLAAEYVPARRRPFAVTLTIVCVPLGGTLAGLIAVPALPAIGWRGLFALGGVAPLLAVFALARVLPESPHYLARHPARWPELRRVLARMRRPVMDDAAFSLPGAKPATRTRLADLVAPGLARDTVALWAAFISCLLAVYLGLSWLPTIITASGLSSAVASTSIMLFNLGGVAGAIAGGAVIGRFGSRATMLTMAALAAGGAATLAATPLGPAAPLLPLYLLLTLTGGLINAVQTTMYALAAHIYPASIRATGVGAAASIGRFGAILSGYAGPWLLDLAGTPTFFAGMAAAVGVAVIALAAIGRHIAARA